MLETARGGMLRAGLGFDRCDVAVVTNIGEGDHLGLADIETLEKLAKVKRCIVDVVPPEGHAVLKADDPHVAPMAEYCLGKVIFFALSAADPTIVAHRQVGGKAVFVQHGTIVLAEGDSEIPLASLSDVPLTHGGRISFQVENALAAVAAAWALGISREPDPGRPGKLRRRHGQGPRPLQPAGNRRRHGDRRLRPQSLGLAGDRRSHRAVPPSPADRGLLRRRRPPRRRHAAARRNAGHCLRPGDPVRRSLRPRPRNRRDHGPVPPRHDRWRAGQ